MRAGVFNREIALCGADQLGGSVYNLYY